MDGAPSLLFLAPFAALLSHQKALQVDADTARLVLTTASLSEAGDLTILRRWSTQAGEASVPSSTPFFCFAAFDLRGLLRSTNGPRR